MLSLVHWLEDHMMTCYYKQVSGIDCPGCGMQRSFIEMLKGDFMSSFKLYPALLPVIITLGITVSHLYFNFKNGAAIIKFSFIFTTSIVIISYVIKLLK